MDNNFNQEKNDFTLADNINDPTVERGEVDLSNSKKASSKVRKLTASLLFVLGLVVLFLLLFRGDNKAVAPKEKEPTVETNPTRNFANDQRDILLKQLQAQKNKMQPPAKEEVKPEVKDEVKGETHTTVVVKASEDSEEEPDPDLVRRLSGEVLVPFDVQKHTPKEGGPSDRDNRGITTESIMHNRMTRTDTHSVVATLRGDQTYLMKKGTNIACTLQTKIITTQPGFTQCVVNRDVYSANGEVLLIERGSMVVGEQVSQLTQGQARVFVMWHTIDTPYGVKIEIDSPSTGPLGEAGVDSQVDTHFWKRFGGAIMLSMIDDVMVNLSNRSKNYNNFENTTEATNDMASEALSNTIDIPPTGYVNQGSLINIIVARDVDFKPVYEVVKMKK